MVSFIVAIVAPDNTDFGRQDSADETFQFDEKNARKTGSLGEGLGGGKDNGGNSRTSRQNQ
jgi:hypothetical protein